MTNKERYQRVEQEKIELDHKRDKLNDFITNNPNFKNLSEKHQNLLKHQASAMNLYSYFLNARLLDMELNGYLKE